MAFLDFFTGFDSEEEQARSDRLDAELRALNEKQREQRGEDWFQQAQGHIDDNRIDDVGGEVNDAFIIGWGEGVDNIRNGVGNTISGATGTIFGIVPWQLWIGAAIYLAFRFGAFNGLLKK